MWLFRAAVKHPLKEKELRIWPWELCIPSPPPPPLCLSHVPFWMLTGKIHIVVASSRALVALQVLIVSFFTLMLTPLPSPFWDFFLIFFLCSLHLPLPSPHQIFIHPSLLPSVSLSHHAPSFPSFILLFPSPFSSHHPSLPLTLLIPSSPFLHPTG